jgi:non-heme chloroperoxidase
MREGNATLKVYKGYPHDMATIHADVINADLLACIRSSWRGSHE